MEYTRWSTTMQTRYNPSEEIKKQAEQSGLSVMLEETKESENPNEVLSVTDQGITITAVQTIVDQYGVEMTFRIEGFDLPEGRFPGTWPTVSIDGDEHFLGGQSGEFFDGTTRDEHRNWVYLDGTPVQMDGSGCAILRYVAKDGSLEYTHLISFQETDGRYLGKEIEVKFQYIGIQSEKRAEPNEPIVTGDWTLRWTLTGTDSKVPMTFNTEIGDSNVVLLDAEIGQHTIRARYQMHDYQEVWTDYSEFPQKLWGVRLKDGSEHICGGGTCGFEDQEKMIYFTEYTISDTILDLDQVESLMFHKGWENDSNGKPTIQTFYYIPISTN